MNLKQQTFQFEIFDFVITQDVLEHVLNPDKGFSEIARTLKLGGVHIANQNITEIILSRKVH